MDETRKYLALGLSAGSFAILGVILAFHGQKEVVFAMMTGVLGILGTVAGFFFGSTEGSQRKTEIIKDLTECKEIPK